MQKDTQTEIRPSWQPVVFRSLRYVIGIALLIYVFSLVPVTDVVAATRRGRPDYLLSAFIVAIGLQWLVAYRLRLVVNSLGAEYSTIELFAINAATRFYGLFLPGGNVTGIAVRFYKIAAPDGMYAETAVTLYSERMIATTTLCTVGLIFRALDQTAENFWLVPIMAAVLLGSLYLLALLMGYAPLPLAGLVDRGIDRIGGSTVAKLRLAVERTRDLPGNVFIVILALSFLIHLIGILIFILIALSLGWNISFVSMGWIRSGLILATMIPISISGLGLREAAALLLLGAYGADEAVAFSLLVFAVTLLFFALVGGMIETRRLTIEKRA